MFCVLNFLNQISNLNICQYISVLNGCNYVVYLCYWVSGICLSSSFMNRTHIMWLRCSFWQMQLSRWLPRFSPEDGNRSNFQRLCNSKNLTHIEYEHNSVNISFVVIFFKVPFEEDEEMAKNEPNGTADRGAVLSVCWHETAQDWSE